MWDGIEADGASKTLDFSECEVDDMINGISVKNGALFKCLNSRFLNNYRSVYFFNVPATVNPYVATTYNGYIMQSEFKTIGTGLLPPYAGEKGKYGVYISNCQQVNIGGLATATDGNLFDNLKTGVYIDYYQPNKQITFNARINLYNNRFTNITGGNYGKSGKNGGYLVNTIYNDPEGTAIFGKNVGSNPYWYKVRIDNSIPSVPSQSVTHFQNCSKGITLTALSAWVARTNMANLTWAESFSSTDQAQFNIEFNNLKNVFYGLSFVGNTLTNWTYNNTIDLASSNNIMFNNINLMYPVGIVINNGLNTVQGFHDIGYNEINVNSFGGVGIGMDNATSQARLEENYVNLKTNTSSVGVFNPIANYPLHGIFASFCDGTQIQGNHITGTNAVLNTSRANVSGIYMSESPRLLLQCNHVKNTKFGFLVVGNCTTGQSSTPGQPASQSDQRVLSNYFENHAYGILFRNNGNEGTLGDIGTVNFDNANNFAGNYTTISGNLMKVYKTTTCPSPFLNRIFTKTTLTNQESGTSNNSTSCRYNVASNNSPTVFDACPSNLPRLTNGNGNNVDIPYAQRIARDSIIYPEFQDGASWLDRRRLYFSLVNDSIIRALNPVLDSFYYAMSGSVFQTIDESDGDIAMLSDSTVLADSVLFDQYMQAALAAQQNFNTNELQEYNETIINPIYIKYHIYGIDSMTQEDSAAIATVALQCPFLGGAAVYKARGLYALFIPPMMYDDIDICNAAGVYKGGPGLHDEENATLMNMQPFVDQAEDIVSVSPNPTTGNIIVTYQVPRGTTSIYIQIFDLYGRELTNKSLDPYGTSGNVELNNYANGIYYYRFSVNGVQKASGKIMLNK